MTQSEVFNALHRGGAFTLPYLMEIKRKNKESFFFVNNNENIDFNNETYIASTFKYTRPKTVGGMLQNGSLEITAINNDITELTAKERESIEIRAVGIIEKSGEITPIKTFKHQYGTVTINEQMKLSITFSNDDRGSMTFPPYIFDSDNNNGNA